MRRIGLPLALACVGLYLLVGCIYIPTFNGVTTGTNYSKRVGDAGSNKPVRVGRSTRDDVLRIFGAPYMMKADRSGVAYTWTVQRGIAVWPLCFHAEPVRGDRTLVLRFDEAGRLASSEVLKWNAPIINFGVANRPILPADFRDEQRRATILPRQ